MMSREKRLEKAQLKVLFTVPFFAVGVAKLPITIDDTVPTASTDGKGIRINGPWLDKLNDQEIVTVLCHEVSHPLLGHLWRAPMGADPDLWNQACDHAVNNQLEEFAKLVTAKNLANPFPFPDGAWCKNPSFANMSEEQIYSILASTKSPNPQGQQGQQGQGQGQSGQGQGQGQGKPQPGKGQGQGQGKGRQPFGEFSIGNASDPAAAKAKVDWEHTFVQSCAVGKGRGNLPGSMARILGDFLDPKVPWYELLRKWLREQATDDWNWSKANTYFPDSEFIMPVLESDRIGYAVFAKDTSGSIDTEQGQKFNGEEQSFLDECRPTALIDICCDSAIHRVKEYGVGDKIDPDFPGGGGTDFRPVFDHVESLPRPPKCLVYFTDLDGTFPSEAPAYPVLWVTWSPDAKAPFGQVVRV